MKKYSISRDIWESFCVLLTLMALPACLVLNVLLLWNQFTRWPFIIGYTLWAGYDMMVDRKDRVKPWWSGKTRRWKGKSWLVAGVRGYFNGVEIKFIDKDSVCKIKGPIIYGCHPHGIFGLSTLINFGLGSHEGGIVEALPDAAPVHVLTLRLSFLIPFWRDILVRLGLGPVDRVTCREILKESKHSIAIVIGGAREALNARPGHYELILEKRKGIFKLAMNENVPIIPVFSFGDVDLYNQIALPWPASLLQSLSIKMTGFSLPVLSGRFGTILPIRRRLFTVIGRPMFPKGKCLDEFHSEYKSQLREIFSEFASKDTGQLIIN